MGQLIQAACESGNLTILQVIDRKHFTNANKLFSRAVSGTHCNIAKWLVTEGMADVHYKDDKFYIKMCDAGRLGTAKWIIEYGIDNTLYPKFIYAACEHNDLEKLKWILSISENIDVARMFETACTYGNDKIMEWLSNNYDIAEYPKLFTGCQYMSTGQWFMDKFRYSSTPYFWYNYVFYILNRENNDGWKHVLINGCDVIYYPSSGEIDETAVINFMAGLKRPKSATTSL